MGTVLCNASFIVVGESCAMFQIKDSSRPSHNATPKGFANRQPGRRLRSECHANLYRNRPGPQRNEISLEPITIALFDAKSCQLGLHLVERSRLPGCLFAKP